MTVKVSLSHITEFNYDRFVCLSPQIVRLKPAPHCRTPISSYSLKIEPSSNFINWQQDPNSNHLARIVFKSPTKKFKITVGLIAEMISINAFDFFLEDCAVNFPFFYDVNLKKELIPFLELSENGPILSAYIKKFQYRNGRTIDFLVEINKILQESIKYVVRLEPGIQDCEKTLASREGSCRDTAWLLVNILRQLGFASRFVSGYLIQLTPDKQLQGEKSGPASDFTDLHAWTEVYLPGAGWIGLDPTSGMLAGEGHIPLACSANPEQAAPTSGTFTFDKNHPDDRCETEFKFHMSISRIAEKPRSTKPYSKIQWSEICDTAKQVDHNSKSNNVGLTIGGEPTFVSINDKDGEEWNTTALGQKKLLMADNLLHGLMQKFSPGGFLHHGQGKWYPGEILPRWALSCYWRKDNVPIWLNNDLFSRESVSYKYTSNDAKIFIDELCGNIGLDEKFIQPAFEDAWYFMWREQKLPINLNPLNNMIENPEESNLISKIFNQGLDKVVGYVLPLKFDYQGKLKHWTSCSWDLRRKHLFLIPGDSPMGYRLPLDSIYWVDPRERDLILNHCPTTPIDLLPKLQHRLKQTNISAKIDRYDFISPQIRTALCVEIRNGQIKVFMPPLSSAVEYFELLKEIEKSSEKLGYSIQIEGYPPPFDPRILNFKITPDPGVIEVNIHPSESWKEHSEKTFILHEEAAKCGLCSEKFMLDGRHTGTGGGNHIVLGGATPLESPFLRRPDLLRSMLSYWNNHPSLSYFFSGLFIGPTCQAPRLDESRIDAIAELEIAFEQINPNTNMPPWLVDRVYRHFLSDSTGNTHRSEFCIDKLYSPDNITGRLGLLELRGFEMAPDPKMEMVQSLLVKSLICMFWKTPYDRKMVRWGTQLHDKFMLPHYLEEDFREVVMDLNDSGFDLKEEWFAPHYEFRFPRIGVLNKNNISMELRIALEPWRVLGEENNPSGTVRFVDSSLERIQVKIDGMTDPRHIILCNNSRIPLHPTGTTGEYVGAIRYRAWQPPSCLHPTIPVHAPLKFDIYDTWSKCSIGGCTYHVSHPGGRSYDKFPVNSREAEGRRLARFVNEGHNPFTFEVPFEEVRPSSPLTLDLRYKGVKQRHKKHSNDKITSFRNVETSENTDQINGVYPARNQNI